MSSSFSEYRAAGGPNSRINQKKERKRLEAKIKQATEGGALPKQAEAYNTWLRKNTGIKLMPDGSKQKVWKTGETKGQPFDAKKGKEQFKQEYFGTTTPRQDLKYLKQLDRNELRIDRLRSNKLRTAASQKDWEGKSIHQLEVDQLEEKLAKEAEELKVGSSYKTPADKLQINNNNEVETNTTGGTGEEGTGETKRQGGQGGRELGSSTKRGGTDEKPDFETLAGGDNAFNDPAYQTNNTSSRERLTARERMRAENVERFGGGEAGEWHVSKLEERNRAFQEAKRGGREAMAEFRKPENYGENLGSYLRSEKLKIDPKKKKPKPKVNIKK